MEVTDESPIKDLIATVKQQVQTLQSLRKEHTKKVNQIASEEEKQKKNKKEKYKKKSSQLKAENEFEQYNIDTILAKAQEQYELFQSLKSNENNEWNQIEERIKGIEWKNINEDDQHHNNRTKNQNILYFKPTCETEENIIDALRSLPLNGNCNIPFRKSIEHDAFLKMMEAEEITDENEVIQDTDLLNDLPSLNDSEYLDNTTQYQNIISGEKNETNYEIGQVLFPNNSRKQSSITNQSFKDFANEETENVESSQEIDECIEANKKPQLLFDMLEPYKPSKKKKPSQRKVRFRNQEENLLSESDYLVQSTSKRKSEVTEFIEEINKKLFRDLSDFTRLFTDEDICVSVGEALGCLQDNDQYEEEERFKESTIETQNVEKSSTKQKQKERSHYIRRLLTDHSSQANILRIKSIIASKMNSEQVKKAKFKDIRDSVKGKEDISDHRFFTSLVHFAHESNIKSEHKVRLSTTQDEHDIEIERDP